MSCCSKEAGAERRELECRPSKNEKVEWSRKQVWVVERGNKIIDLGSRFTQTGNYVKIP